MTASMQNSIGFLVAGEMILTCMMTPIGFVQP